MNPEIVVAADIRFPLERANGVQIVKTAAALARTGARTTLLVRQSDPRPTDEVLGLYGLSPHAGLEVQRLPVGHRPGAFTIPRASFLARAVLAVRAGLRRGGIVFTRDLQLADLLLRLRQSPVVYEAHAVESLMYGERGLLYGTAEKPEARKAARIAARERRVWRRAHAFVTTTAGTRDTFSEAYGPRERTRVVPNGCDVPLSRSFPGLPDGARVLYAGQLYPWKGVDVLVEAVALVPQARLVVAGGLEGEGDLARVRALVRARGIGERTEMLGTIPQGQVAAEMAKAAVVVAPFLRSAMTERHTSPLKAFEAMAAGRPIVASDLPSSREILEDGRTAILVPPGEAAPLAGAVDRLLRDRPLALRLAKAAYDEAPRYSWDARARALRELMEEAL